MYNATNLPTGMAHVERRELYENLQARLQYLQSFLEFGPADIKVLNECRPFIKALIPTLSDNHFFTKLLKQDITAQALITKNTKEEVYLDGEDFYGPESKNVQNRNMFVRWYLTRMNSDPSKTSYWEYMNTVGAMHAGHHRRNPLEIDVIHFSLLIGYVQNILTEAILLSTVIPTHQKAPLVKAWGKLLWIQMDLFTKWHVKDGKEYDQLTTRATKLDASTEFNGLQDEEGREVKCPFSSVARLEPVTVNGQLKKSGYVYQDASMLTRDNIPGGGIGSIESISQPFLQSPPLGGRMPRSPPPSNGSIIGVKNEA